MVSILQKSLLLQYSKLPVGGDASWAEQNPDPVSALNLFCCFKQSSLSFLALPW